MGNNASWLHGDCLFNFLSLAKDFWGRLPESQQETEMTFPLLLVVRIPGKMHKE